MLYFFHNIWPKFPFDLIWPKFCPRTSPTLIFFAGFQWNMLGDLININNFNWNPIVLKNVAKTSKKLHFFGSTCVRKWGPCRPHPKQIIFLQKWQNQIISFQKPFILSELMFRLSYECFSILCDAFLRRSVISSHNSCDTENGWNRNIFFVYKNWSPVLIFLMTCQPIGSPDRFLSRMQARYETLKQDIFLSRS